ncbi:Bug family tripartite tricarboxylate transporter substrate binding protein [Advenella mimigardefordensis]|uniref:Putative Bug-like extracytoplasmic solute binding receptor, TTT family n=1 Tax=Advenella mimigardefordensis (strain DSM 17166 / LMG 22922 / DPN7) TaxID=1247726 RepID=W0PLF9_ADVMD|nr:tripartite tricarboxylate transporter substrate binding protein [Advenella mimigardefordensis]AHG65813.1 putative Bug-like extracytoplasmic solute binding receptor, TTT family [Advenella mimigardefordensis DPN7]
MTLFRNATVRWLNIFLAVGALTFAAVSVAATADQNFPNKPIRLIVSYPAGGSVDVAARILQEPLSKGLGQSVVIENKGGAGGTIGTAQVAKAAPDGYTLLLTLSSHTINPAIYAQLPFDTEKDLDPVSMVASAPQVLVAHPSFKPSTIPELIAYAKAADTPVIYGSAGVGSPSHIAGELFKKLGQVQLTHAPYRGGGPATVDVLGGQIPLLWVSLPAVTQYIRNGKLKALAVSTKERTPVLPDVPSVAETLDGFNVDSWYAMFAPAGTPRPIIDKIQKVLAQAAGDKAIQDAFLAQGAVVVGGTPEALDAVVKKEIPAWKTLAKEANIKIN